MSLRSRLRVRTRLRSAIHSICPPKPKPLILNYHRIIEPAAADFWGLAVSPAHFKEQLEVLRRYHRPLPLMDFCRDLYAGTLPSNAVALTIDDGYIDNLMFAKPLLTAADVPATVFLATGFIDRPEPFWWDELAAFILLGNRPQSFDIMIGGQSMHFDFDNGSDSPTVDLRARDTAVWKIWRNMRLLEDESRQSAMANLRAIFAASDHQISFGRAMTGHEVREIASDGLVTVGAHTISHAVLPELEPTARRLEITGSKRACEALVEKPVVAFAYPYGDFNTEAREDVKAAGFLFACSTRRRAASVACDAFSLPRVHVPNIDGNTFEKALRFTSAEG